MGGPSCDGRLKTEGEGGRTEGRENRHKSFKYMKLNRAQQVSAQLRGRRYLLMDIDNVC